MLYKEKYTENKINQIQINASFIRTKKFKSKTHFFIKIFSIQMNLIDHSIQIIQMIAKLKYLVFYRKEKKLSDFLYIIL